MVNILTPALSASGCGVRSSLTTTLLRVQFSLCKPRAKSISSQFTIKKNIARHPKNSHCPRTRGRKFAAGFDLTTAYRVRRAQSQLLSAAEPFLRPKRGSVLRCLQRDVAITRPIVGKAKRSTRWGTVRGKTVPSSPHSLPNRIFLTRYKRPTPATG
jgi:hypothetical protein